MSNGFYGLEIARSALNASQAALEVTSQNIANASTAGYSRRRATLADVGSGTLNTKFYSPRVPVGGGVTVSNVEQIRDAYLDTQYRSANSANSEVSTLSDSLSQLEDIFSEFQGNSDTATGLSGRVSDLLTALSKLTTSPDDAGLLASVRTSMSALTQTVRTQSKQLDSLESQAKQELGSALDSGLSATQGGVNVLVQNIASLNRQIATYELSGTQATDLRDTRNRMLDQLSSQLDIKVTEQKNGMVSVSIAGDDTHSLIDAGNNVTKLKLNDDSTAVLWEDGSTANITGGGIAGRLEFINSDGSDGAVGIPLLRKRLDDFATGLAAAFNAASAGGKTDAKPLLSATSAADFGLTDAWRADTSLLTQGATGTDTGGFIAQLMGVFTESGGIDVDGSPIRGTLQDYTDSISTDIADRLAYVKSVAASTGSILSNASTQRQSVMGVSINDESVNLIKYQQSYTAAARVITTIDEMIQTLLETVR